MTTTRDLFRERRRQMRANIDPIVSGVRVSSLPKPMAANPTVSVTDSATSYASAFQYFAWVNGQPDPRIRRLSPTVVQRPAAGVGFDGAAVIPVMGSGGVITDYAMSHDVMLDAQSFEVIIKDQGATANFLRLLVDGEWAWETGIDYAWSGNGNYLWVKFDFGSKRVRHVVIETSAVAFRGIAIAKTDSAWAPHSSAGPVALFIGDSFAQGARLTAKPDTFGYTCGRALGWRRVISSGRGGTGYLRTLDGSNFPKFRDRLDSDVFPHRPDIVGVCGGINDQGVYTQAQIYEEARHLYRTIRAGLPGVALFASGPWYPTGRPIATIVQCRDAIRQACADERVPYVETIGGPYPYSGSTSAYHDTGFITGSGTTQGTQGDGNGDIYTGHSSPTDTTHPTRAGQIYLGLRLAAALAEMPVF